MYLPSFTEVDKWYTCTIGKRVYKEYHMIFKSNCNVKYICIYVFYIGCNMLVQSVPFILEYAFESKLVLRNSISMMWCCNECFPLNWVTL